MTMIFMNDITASFRTDLIIMHRFDLPRPGSGTRGEHVTKDTEIHQRREIRIVCLPLLFVEPTDRHYWGYLVYYSQ